MNIRRPVAALFVALALVGGPAVLTGCSAAGDGQSDGTSDGDSSNTSGADPGGTSQGNLPDNSDNENGEDDSTDG